MIKDSPFMIYGIFSPQKYRDVTVYPIACPSMHAGAMLALSATDNPDNLLSAGCNGEVWSVDKDHVKVVKKLFKPETATNYQPDRERKALVALEVNGIYSPNIQSGWMAFTTKAGDTFITSSQIKGKKPDPKTNKFTPQNIKQMIETMVYLDRPDWYWNHKKPFSSPKLSLLMHYDLKPGNILINKDNFGVIDFEYLDFIKAFANRTKKGKENWGILCNCSDVPDIPTNLRNMEYRSLLPYLEKADTQEAKIIFRKYLKAKSTYHKEMVSYYSSLYKKLPIITLSSIINPQNTPRAKAKNIIKSHIAHSRVLRNPDENVIKSEAIKIQIARYIYLLSTKAHGDKTTINLEQIKNYILDAESFFREESEHTFGAKKIYYKNNLELLKIWKRIIPIISDNTRKNKLDYYRDISSVSNDSSNETTMNKTIFTNEHQITLDEIVK